MGSTPGGALRPWPDRWPREVVVGGQVEHPDPEVAQRGVVVQVHRQLGDLGLPARLLLGAGAQLDLVELPVLQGVEFDLGGVQHPVGRPVPAPGRRPRRSAGPVHLEPVAAQAHPGPSRRMCPSASTWPVAWPSRIRSASSMQVLAFHRPVHQGPAGGALLHVPAPEPERFLALGLRSPAAWAAAAAVPPGCGGRQGLPPAA